MFIIDLLSEYSDVFTVCEKFKNQLSKHVMCVFCVTINSSKMLKEEKQVTSCL